MLHLKSLNWHDHFIWKYRKPWLSIYLPTSAPLFLCLLFIVDLIWLSQLAQPLYKAGIGHLMADKPNLGLAALFYLVFVFGLLLFALRPNIGAKNVKSTFIAGALFALFYLR